jgi:hypothetical protein
MLRILKVQPMVLKQRIMKANRITPMVLISEEVDDNQLSKPAIPTEQVIVQVALISELEWDANDFIKIFHCPRFSKVVTTI